MTRVECTGLFQRYAEISRLIWNLGFWPYTECRTWASERAYDSAIARLFEGMVLRPLGCEGRVERTFRPGDTAQFRVEIATTEADLMVDGNPPDVPGRLWGNPTVRSRSPECRLRFVAFFDWYQLAPREYRLLEVLIERLDGDPKLAGRHALIEFNRCSIFLEP